MPASQRITLRDIAEKSGYHFTTVSLALREDPSIPETTRAKIKRVALALGYRPDPMLSALASYRHAKNPPAYTDTLLWLCHYTPDYRWQDIPLYREYFEGIEEEGTKLGYRLEAFDLNAKGLTPKRANQILRTRGISGLFIPPQVHAGAQLELDWDSYSVIAFGYTLRSPQFHVVSSHHFRMMEKLQESIYELGYRRPGLVMLKKSSERVEHIWISAFLGQQWVRRGAGSGIQPLFLEAWDEPRFREWYDKSQPDIIIAGQRQIPEILPALQSMGLKIPEDLAFADHNLSDSNMRIAGMKQNGREVGRTALRQLVGMIHRNERGIPRIPSFTLVEGYFFHGPTIRPD